MTDDRQPVLDAFGQLSPASWWLLLRIARGVLDGVAMDIVDDPTPEVAAVVAIDAALARLQRRETT